VVGFEKENKRERKEEEEEEAGLQVASLL